MTHSSKRLRPRSVTLALRSWRYAALLCAVYLVTSARPAQAGINVWTSNGPDGGAVLALAIDPRTPTTLYTGTDRGVFKSTDGGGAWIAASSGLSRTEVNALAIDPQTPATLYAGTQIGLFKSTDGEATWSAANTGLLTYQSVFALAIDPSTPTTLYAGTYYDAFKSTDGGDTWHATGFSGGVRVLAIDPKTPTTLYAGAGDNRVFKSSDGGATWGAIGLTWEVRSFAIDPQTPTTLYGGVSNPPYLPGGGDVFKSADGGDNWSATGLERPVAVLATAPTTPTTVYAAWLICRPGMYGSTDCYAERVSKSTDAGRTWSDTTLFLAEWEFVTALAIDPLTPTTLYASTSAGATGGGRVYKSTDGGDTWNTFSTGLPDIPVLALAIDPIEPQKVYAGTGGGGVFAIEQAQVVGTGKPKSCTEAALDAALAGGGLVTFDCGLEPVTITITSTKNIAADTTIDGGGRVTIGGGGSVRVFRVDSAVRFTLENLTIAGGNSEDDVEGGGVYINYDGMLMVTNSTFSSNSGYKGGGIFNNFGTLTVTNSTFSGNNAHYGGGIFNIGTLTVTSCTFSGNSGYAGGGIFNDYGTATVTNSTFSGNSGAYGDADAGGGGIASSGTLTVTNSTFSGNSGGNGGGIASSGTLTVINSTFSGNSSAYGGGIFSGGSLTDTNNVFLTVTNSTFSGNSGYAGGGIHTLGTATVSNSTISGNGGYGIGIGICSSPPYVFCTDSTLTVTNSIVADSTGRGDCVIYSGTVTDGGHNLIDDAANSCGLTNGVKGNIVGVDPMLDPAGLKDNGGPTQTIALLPNSPAIEAGDNASCPATDQRGYARPGSGHTQCSIGAYEADAFSPEPCVGDCDGTGGVTVDEIITLVNIALGNTQPSACPHGVPSGAEINVALIIQAVDVALNGCADG